MVNIFIGETWDENLLTSPRLEISPKAVYHCKVDNLPGQPL